MTFRRTAALALLAGGVCALALSMAGCSRRRIVLPIVPNQPPEVVLTQAPAVSDRPYFYAYTIFWTGYDPDGRVDHYLYAIDPPTEANAETSWVSLTGNRQTFLFRSDDSESLGTRTNPGGFHVFVMKAVDDRGAMSPPVSRAFLSYTVAPTVTFIQPKTLHPLLRPLLPPTTTITWTGDDPDGQVSRKPVKFKYKLFPEDGLDFTFLELLLRPDSLRRYYAPTFPGWDSVSGDTVSVTLMHMIPDKRYVFVAVALDEAGAYTSIFTLDGNMLFFYVGYSSGAGPRMTVWSDFFNYTYQSGGYNTDPSAYVRVEVPYQQKIRFSWSATPYQGTELRGFRWALDIARLDDETPRSGQDDVAHWSTWGVNNTQASVGPFTGGAADSLELHRFCIEARDNNDFRSLAVIEFRVVRPRFLHDLLFVDDTRFVPDYSLRQRPDSVLAPSGPWPSAAELDTFLFARGGVRWRYYIPSTQQSTPGIFSGYEFDTLDTRGLRGGTVPLSTLVNYRHVVWYAGLAQMFTGAPGDLRLPMPALRFMSAPGRGDVLAIYSGMGGKLWLMGGGIAYNSLLPYNQTANDAGGAVFTRSSGELAAGRLMWTLPHWRSAISCLKQARAAKNPALATPAPGLPDYSVLPDLLVEREGAGLYPPDPVPPMRSPGTFYLTQYDGEILTQPNVIEEDVDPDPDVVRMGPTLDTLYTTGDVVQYPVMTCYRGSQNAPVVFSGFPLWHFRRAQAIALGDAVLQRLWGLPRAPVER